MRFLDSPHVRPHSRLGNVFTVDMSGRSLEGVLDTLKWAFPDARIVNGERGNYYVLGECGTCFGFVVDFSDLTIEVYENHGLPDL